MLSAETKIVIAWLLFVALAVNNIRVGFAAYRADGKPWKLAVHLAALLGLGVLIADLGVFALRMKYDQDEVVDFAYNYPHPKVTSAQKPPQKKAAKAAPAPRAYGR